MSTSLSHIRRGSTRRANGFAFTLIELLIVVAVIAILTSIILPVLISARRRAGLTACSSNLGQLHLAYAMYASDNSGDLPPYHTITGFTRYGRPVPDSTAELVAALLPYTKSSQIWFCPADPWARKDWPDMTSGNVNHHYTSYTYGTALPFIVGVAKSPPKFDMGQSSMSVLLTDNLSGCKNIAGTKNVYAYSHGGGRFTAVYYDGHVKSFSIDDHANCVSFFP